MPDDKIFRVKREQPEEQAPIEPHETPNLTEGREDGAVRDESSEEVKRVSPLEAWEIEHGKYGAEYLGIQEIVKEFPLSAQFGIVDRYIKSLLDGSETPGDYQRALDAIEEEIGSAKLNPYDRVKKLSEYVKVIEKYEKAKRLKEAFK